MGFISYLSGAEASGGCDCGVGGDDEDGDVEGVVSEEDRKEMMLGCVGEKTYWWIYSYILLHIGKSIVICW